MGVRVRDDVSAKAGNRHRPLDRRSALPLYHQLFIDLRRRLLDGEWRPGDPFPKDAEIEAAYTVSRITVRQAVSLLVDTNIVVRFRGRGSFVGNLPRDDATVNHRIVTDEILAAGWTPTHENRLPVERHAVSDLTARQLGCAVGDTVTILKRLHRADGVPFCYESIMLHEGRFEGVFDRVSRDEETLLDAYARLGIVVAKADQSVSAGLLSDERRAVLEIPDGVPALIVERVGYSATNEPLDMRRLYYRGDKFTLRQEIIWGMPETRIL